MLKKIYRGLSEKEVSALFTKLHKTAVNRFFRINWKKQGTDTDHSQFVVIVPPSVSRSAVKRNRLRRRAYELIRTHFSAWTDVFQVAILVKPAAAKLEPRQFSELFLNVLRKIL